MQITLQPLDLAHLAPVGQCDSVFTVTARLSLSAEHGRIRYTLLPTEPYEKRYPAEPVDYAQYIGHANKALFLAYANGQLAGELRLCRDWNNFAYIENIVVEAAFRRQGVGRALIERAQQWAVEKQLAGVRLETQDINVGACRLYEHCGFELGGFDRYLYHGLQLQEVALYWYWLAPTSGVV